MRIRITTAILAVIMAVGSLALGVASPAEAARRSRSKENAWRIGTYIGSAATIAALAKGEGTWALVGGGATLLSYTQWRNQMRSRHRREDRQSYRNYRTRWFRRYRGHRVHRR